MCGRAAQVPVLARPVRPLAHHIQGRRQHPQGRCQRDAPFGHPRQEPRIQAHAVLQGIHPGGDRRRPSGRLLGVHGNPPARCVHRLDDRREHTDGNRLILRRLVRDDLGPPGTGSLGRRDRGQLRVIGPTAPAVEELTVLRDPRPGMHRARHVIIKPEPRGRLTGQAR